MNSVVVGHLAQVLALAGDLDQDMAFTAGLLHNIGRLAFAHHRPAQLAECRAEAAASRRSIHDVQRTRYGYADCELGATIADGWRLPQPLVASIQNHGRPLSTLPERTSLDATVARARRFARAHAISDGLDVVGTAPLPDLEWQSPGVQRALRQIGGIGAAIERAKSYLTTA